MTTAMFFKEEDEDDRVDAMTAVRLHRQMPSLPFILDFCQVTPRRELSPQVNERDQAGEKFSSSRISTPPSLTVSPVNFRDSQSCALVRSFLNPSREEVHNGRQRRAAA